MINSKKIKNIKFKSTGTQINDFGEAYNRILYYDNILHNSGHEA